MVRASVTAAITGWGMAVPDTIMTNGDLEKIVDTSDEWIVSRTGIRERRIAGPKDSTTSLAVQAAREALSCAGLEATDLDLIVCGTCTPDQLLVSEACLIQAELGGHAGAFDVGSACSGFVYALAVGSQFVQSGTAHRVLVIGVDTLTRFIDFTDRSTCVLFGDGAGAVILEASDAERGLLSTVLGADGSGWRSLFVPGWHAPVPAEQQLFEPEAPLNGHVQALFTGLDAPQATTAPPTSVIDSRPTLAPQPSLQMQGSDVFRFAVKVMGDAAVEAVERAGLSVDEIDMFIPHQANARIIEAAARRLDLDRTKVFVNVDRYGNTSAASVPMALYEAEAAGKLHDGDNLVFVAFGGGLSWAAGVVRWGRAGVARFAEDHANSPEKASR